MSIHKSGGFMSNNISTEILQALEDIKQTSQISQDITEEQLQVLFLASLLEEEQ